MYALLGHSAQNTREKSESKDSKSKEGPNMPPLNLGWFAKNLGNIVAPENSSESTSAFAKTDPETHIDTAEPLPLTPVRHSSMHTHVDAGSGFFF